MSDKCDNTALPDWKSLLPILSNNHSQESKRKTEADAPIKKRLKVFHTTIIPVTPHTGCASANIPVFITYQVSGKPLQNNKIRTT